MLRYYQYVWSVNNFFDRETFLEELSPALQDEVSLRISGRLVQQVPLFKSLPLGCITQIVSRLKQRLYIVGDVIIHENSFGREVRVHAAAGRVRAVCVSVVKSC